MPRPRHSSLITTAFGAARANQNAVYSKWVQISWKIGGRLPNSRLFTSVQRDGELDILLRCMEDEHKPPAEEQDFSSHYLNMLSELWVGGVYETYRLMIDRKIAPDDEEFRRTAHDLRLLRIPLEKHEIAGDRKLDQPLLMKNMSSSGQDRDLYAYSRTDPLKAHIMPAGISARGSVMWQIIDLQSNQERWIERRELSDRIIEFWASDRVLGMGELEARQKASQEQHS
jgi:hypothetical protein